MSTPRHGWPSRVIALTTALTSLLLLGTALELDVTSSIVLLTAVAVGGVLGAGKMWAHNCFESHAAISFVTTIVLLGTVLSLTLGLPGSDRSQFGLLPVALVALPLTTLTLQAVEWRRRRDAAHTVTPYAY